MQITTSPLDRLTQRGVAFAPEITTAAQRHGLDPALLAAVAAQETGGPGSNSGANIVGDGGHGHGVFQIDDRWHRFATSAAAMNPAKNADYAAGMLSGLLKRYGGNVKSALSAYNAGSPSATGTTTRWGDGTVLGYADSVLRHYRNLVGSPSGSDGTPSGASPAGVLQSTLADCRAEQASSAASIGTLANQASLFPLSIPAPQMPQGPNGADSTGHARKDSISAADLIS